MDNIKKFEDFLDRMQGLLDNAKKQGDIMVPVEDLENAFPELKESEDERIRKELVAMVRLSCTNGDDADKKIAWLEKQGEQKSAWSEEDERTLQGIWDEILANKHNAKEYEWKTYDRFLDWLNSIKYRVLPQTKQEWSKEDEEMLEDVKFNFEYNKGEMTDAMIAQYNRFFDKIKSLKPQAKPVWSAEDEKKRTLLIDILKVNHPNDYFKVNPVNTLNMEAMHTEELVSWLESLKQKIKGE